MANKYKLHASGTPITMSQIAQCFEKQTTPNLIDGFYRGGRNVTSGVADNDKNDSIPTSGQIDFADFYTTFGGRSTKHSVTFDTTNDGYGTNIWTTSSFTPTTVWNGVAVDTFSATHSTGSGDTSVSVTINGNRVISFFSRLLFENMTLLTANATRTYDSGTNKTTWQWVVANGTAITGTTGTTTVDVWMYDSDDFTEI